jgi:hypothetical protein
MLVKVSERSLLKKSECFTLKYIRSVVVTQTQMKINFQTKTDYLSENLLRIQMT